MTKKFPEHNILLTKADQNGIVVRSLAQV